MRRVIGAAVLCLCLCLCRGTAAAPIYATPGETALAMIASGQLCLDEGRPDCALRAWAAAYALSPLPSFLLLLAQAAERAGQPDIAVVFYARHIEEDPQGPQRDRSAAALARLRARAPEASPPPVRDLLALGVRQFQRGLHEEAIDSYHSAYALRRLPRILFNLAQAHRRAGRSREALWLYERYLQEEQRPSALSAEARSYCRELRDLLETRREAQRPPRRTWIFAVAGGALAAAGVALALGLSLRPRDELVLEPRFPP